MKFPPKCSTEWEIGKYSLHFGIFFISQGGHWSGKSQGNLIFLQGQGKVREFCKLVREILNTKRVREKSGNFIFFPQNMCCSWYFDNLKCEKSVFSLARFARSKLWKLVNFRPFCAKKLFKDFICFICRIREVHFSELVKGICHLSAAKRQIGRRTAVFWLVKNWIWSRKCHWKVREFCFCMFLSLNWAKTMHFVVKFNFSCSSTNDDIKRYFPGHD